MKKMMIIVASILLVLLVAAGAAFWFWMQKPLYEPGVLRSSQSLRAPLVPPPPSSDKDFWTVENDIRLYHYADGTGTNVLVIHGGPGRPMSQSLPGLKPLTGSYRFNYYDQRGCGKSTRPIDTFASTNYYENMTTLDKTLGIGAQVADIERIRQIMGEDKLFIIGHSFGGFLASLYAAEFPEHVRALILVAPAEILVMPPEDGGLFEQVKPLLPESMKQEYASYLKRYLDYGSIFSKTEADLVALNDEFAKYYALAAKAKGFTLPDDKVETGGWMVHAMYMSMGQRHDYRTALKQVNAPVLIIHGANDLQPEKASRMYAEVFPKAEFRVIPNAGHFVFDDQPDEFSRVTGEFLSKLEVK